ncbi:Crp/Fnr family transcriptional regulator [Hydrogenovibrio kuenenii]|uniref:Crp/Fnr family transcriptional regulator n=1 Tax=Hydrogenovibrio kuenenii TaxID=63658 RepID=UPI000466454C|nr:cyclic nucleotide-binding domain-containing protein [Hydrogenovibrio kuenenii]
MGKADVQLISQSVLGSDLVQEDCEILSDIVKHKKLAQNEILFDAGTVDASLYILINGKLDILKAIGPDKELSINSLKPGSVIGELSFIDGDAHTMRLKARIDSEVLVLHRDDFEQLAEKNNRVVFNVMKSILRYSHNLQRKMLQENLEMHRMVLNEYTTQY